MTLPEAVPEKSGDGTYRSVTVPARAEPLARTSSLVKKEPCRPTASRTTGTSSVSAARIRPLFVIGTTDPSAVFWSFTTPYAKKRPVPDLLLTRAQPPSAPLSRPASVSTSPSCVHSPSASVTTSGLLGPARPAASNTSTASVMELAPAFAGCGVRTWTSARFERSRSVCRRPWTAIASPSAASANSTPGAYVPKLPPTPAFGFGVPTREERTRDLGSPEETSAVREPTCEASGVARGIGIPSRRSSASASATRTWEPAASVTDDVPKTAPPVYVSAATRGAAPEFRSVRSLWKRASFLPYASRTTGRSTAVPAVGASSPSGVNRALTRRLSTGPTYPRLASDQLATRTRYVFPPTTVSGSSCDGPPLTPSASSLHESAGPRDPQSPANAAITVSPAEPNVSRSSVPFPGGVTANQTELLIAGSEHVCGSDGSVVLAPPLPARSPTAAPGTRAIGVASGHASFGGSTVTVTNATPRAPFASAATSETR